MDELKFKELRDSLDHGDRKCVMIKLGCEWTIQYLDNIEYQEGWDSGLDNIEYGESHPDFQETGNLLGFVYPKYNCPAVLGYGRRSEDEIKIMKYIWKSNSK